MSEEKYVKTFESFVNEEKDSDVIDYIIDYVKKHGEELSSSENMKDHSFDVIYRLPDDKNLKEYRGAFENDNIRVVVDTTGSKVEITIEGFNSKKELIQYRKNNKI